MSDRSEMSLKHVLDEVQRKIILKKANQQNLYDLLTIVDSELKYDQVMSESHRLSAIKSLMLRIHPSNFPDNEDAASIYEDVQIFYEACCKNMKDDDSENEDKNAGKKKKRVALPKDVVESVVQFNVRQKWHYLDQYARPQAPNKLTSGKVLAPLIAYQCINARGAIIHGKKPSLIYSWENAKACTGQSVKEVFEKHGGARAIEGRKVEEIKIEIINRGPVVSVTFQPTTALAEKYLDSIVTSRINKRHYAIIVGWKLTEFGEVWLVQTYTGNECMHIPIGQYHIDETIIVPKDSFEMTTWQKGPYYDRDMSKLAGWVEWTKIEFFLKSTQLEGLGELFGEVGLYEAISSKARFAIRDKKKFAQSRTCRLKEIAWNSERKLWKITCVFLDSGAKEASS